MGGNSCSAPGDFGGLFRFPPASTPSHAPTSCNDSEEILSCQRIDETRGGGMVPGTESRLKNPYPYIAQYPEADILTSSDAMVRPPLPILHATTWTAMACSSLPFDSGDVFFRPFLIWIGMTCTANLILSPTSVPPPQQFSLIYSRREAVRLVCTFLCTVLCVP